MTHDPNAALTARRSHLAATRGPEEPLDSAFYDRPTARVARALLGCVLESRIEGHVTRGRIVEVEAYLGPHDPACHSAAGLTERNRQLHGPPGTVYVYRIYGLHWCVNAVTRRAGYGSAVLIRALAPIQGEDAMRRRRGNVSDRQLTNGPGKLCQALGISRIVDGLALDGPVLRILAGAGVAEADVLVTPRIGISLAADWPLRFCVAGEPNVSRAPPSIARYRPAEAAAWLRARRLR